MQERVWIYSSIALALFFISLFPYAWAATATDAATVSITVTNTLAISVQPSNLTYGNITVGTESAVLDFVVRNSGSVNVTSLFLTADTLQTEGIAGALGNERGSPIQGGAVGTYNAAGFIFLRNSSNATYFHAGRVEWNLSGGGWPANASLNISAGAGGQVGVGWYRNNTGWYLWRIQNGSSGGCNSTHMNMVISRVPENSTSTYRDLGVAANVVQGQAVANNSQFTTIQFNGSTDAGPLDDYCVYVYHTCDRIFITKYDANTSYPACLVKSSLRTSNLGPGTEEALKAYASVVEGVPYGSPKLGILTVTASD